MLIILLVIFISIICSKREEIIILIVGIRVFFGEVIVFVEEYILIGCFGWGR